MSDTHSDSNMNTPPTPTPPSTTKPVTTTDTVSNTLNSAKAAATDALSNFSNLFITTGGKRKSIKKNKRKSIKKNKRKSNKKNKRMSCCGGASKKRKSRR